MSVFALIPHYFDYCSFEILSESGEVCLFFFPLQNNFGLLLFLWGEGEEWTGNLGVVDANYYI